MSASPGKYLLYIFTLSSKINNKAFHYAHSLVWYWLKPAKHEERLELMSKWSECRVYAGRALELAPLACIAAPLPSSFYRIWLLFFTLHSPFHLSSVTTNSSGCSPTSLRDYNLLLPWRLPAAECTGYILCMMQMGLRVRNCHRSAG